MPRDWEQHYRGKGLSRDPALVVRAFAGRLPSGEILDLAGGDGRNAFFLAKRGHRVWLLERSPAALEIVREAARGASVEVVACDLEAPQLELPQRPFSGVILSYFVHRSLIPRFAGLLEPGGLVLIEGFGRREAIARGRAESPYYWREGELLEVPERFSLLAFAQGWMSDRQRTWAVWRRI